MVRYFELVRQALIILIKGGSWKTILSGLWVTIQISALALLLGTALGAVVCLLRTRKNPLVRASRRRISPCCGARRC